MKALVGVLALGMLLWGCFAPTSELKFEGDAGESETGPAARDAAPDVFLDDAATRAFVDANALVEAEAGASDAPEALEASPEAAPADAAPVCNVYGQTSCGGTCTDLQSDPTNCGACGKVCEIPGDTCAMGTCQCVSHSEGCPCSIMMSAQGTPYCACGC